MPIVDIEIVLKSNETLRESLAADIANELGEIFNSSRGGTWVKLHELPSDKYAENDEVQNSVHPIFVKIIKAHLPDNIKLQDESQKISNAVAKICGRPSENVHIIFESKGAGRVAFGGKLIL
jgi:phenylpyruvate tautomerase PptA (4-oxalocrotonate tautomerase family)